MKLHPSFRLAGVLKTSVAAVALLCSAHATLSGCAGPRTVAPPPAAPAKAPVPEGITEEQLYAPVIVRRQEERGPRPSPRRRREYIVTEVRFRELARKHPRGFSPADCRALCKQAEAITQSPDGQWAWVLRCLLDRSVRDEPVVNCREDAVEPEKAEKLGPSAL